MKIFLKSVHLAALVCATLAAHRVAADNFTVTYDNSLKFSPATISIHTGDTITWSYSSSGIPHTVTGTGTEPMCGSATFSAQGAGCSHTFTTVGSFPYQCNFHSFSGMTGLVNVASAVIPPTVAITSPVANASFSAPATVSIQTFVNGNGGTVTNVKFFTNGVFLASVTNSPFNFTANNLGAGSYAITAVAFAGGVSNTSPVVSITVTSPPPSPTVSITSPASGAVLAEPANVQVVANAAVSSGTVTNVTFLTNGTLAGSVNGSPFNLTVNGLTAGSYGLTAIATAAGISSTSTVVSISVVAPVAVSATGSAIISNGFSFDYAANVGLSYVVENSSNLVDWLPVNTNKATGSPVHFSDTLAPDANRFYRVGRMPNP